MSSNKFIDKKSLSTVLTKLYDWLMIRTPFMNENNTIVQKGGCEANNEGEVAIGKYNKSTKSSDIKNATLFSVGNGDSTHRDNAMEVKQNGDIYIKKNGEDVCLQDYLVSNGEVEKDEAISIEEIDAIINK